MKSCCLIAVLGLASGAMADSITLNYAGSNANGQSAAASFTFDDTANTVTIRIRNTMGPGLDNAGARDLSAMWWSFTNTQTLGVNYAVSNGNPTPPSGNPGSVTWDATNVSSSAAGTANAPSTPYNAEQMWAFRNDFSGAPQNAQYGLGSAGLSAPANFPRSAILQSGGPAPQPGGPDGTLISATGTPHGSGGQQFRDWVEFEFDVDHSFFNGDIRSIGVASITAQFDTSLNENNQVQMMIVPLPPAAYAGLACLGLVGAHHYRARRRRA